MFFLKVNFYHLQNIDYDLNIFNNQHLKVFNICNQEHIFLMKNRILRFLNNIRQYDYGKNN